VNSTRLPTSTLVGVQSLFQPDYLIEVEAIAVIPEKKSAAKAGRH
jgi:enamine deaminase RidA (YjgF/YER057c/UK114 family)